MGKQTNSIALCLLLLLSAIGVMAQRAADQKKKVPAMSSDELEGAPSATQPIAGSTTTTAAALTRYSPESCGLSIELPSEPHRFDELLGKQERQHMGGLGLSLSSGADYMISVRHYQFPGRGEPSPEWYVTTFLELVSSGGIYTNVNYTLLEKSAKRASFKGSWGDSGPSGHERPQFEGFAQVEGRHIWLVTAMCPVPKASVLEQVRGILSSAKLDGPSCR